jgi:hypothetical protein
MPAIAMHARPDLYASIIAPMVPPVPDDRVAKPPLMPAITMHVRPDLYASFLYYIGRKIHLMHRDQRTHSSHHFARPSFVPAAGRKFRKSTASLPINIATTGLSVRWSRSTHTWSAI